jgi:hypothetical protein
MTIGWLLDMHGNGCEQSDGPKSSLTRYYIHQPNPCGLGHHKRSPVVRGMKFSIKVILLVTAFCAVVVAWIRVRDQMVVAETQLLANTGRNQGSIKVAEANGDLSYFTRDATGVFHTAFIKGPRGLGMLEGERTDFRITSLSVASTEAFLALKSGAVPELERLYLDNIDFSQMTFETLALFPRLKELSINVSKKDLFAALATLPSLENPPLVMLTLRDENDPRLKELKERLPAYTIIVRKQ